jgi:Zn-dependent M28 family amino/carboxypeptidase
MLAMPFSQAKLQVKDSAKPFALTKSASVKTASRRVVETTQNVVALWEGRDSVLKNEMVAIGAHYDHVGINENAPGDDKIYNGADDDGSGTTAVLAIAEALAKSKVRPKRSVLLVWHAGEEKGLWGAEYFNKFPTVDIKNVVAQLNIDMIGRSKDPNNLIPCTQPGRPCNDELSGPNEVYMIGSEMMSSTLGAVAKGTNSAYLNLDYNFKYDDPKDPNRFFFRSDHFHYAVNGIPVIFWFTGVHEDYHQPGDHADKIDYQKMEKITRTIFMTMWKLTDLKERPAVDKQLPPELTTR